MNCDSAQSDGSLLANREFRPSNIPPSPVPVFSLANIPVATKGNLLTITGQPKAGKSAIVGAIIAALLRVTDDGDTLKFRKEGRSTGAVIHIDTELDAPRHSELRKTISNRAGASPLKDPAFASYCCKGDDPATLIRVLEAALAQNAQRHGAIIAVFIDQVGDFVSDPNSGAECFALVSRLERLAKEYDTAIVCVLHLNPSTVPGSLSKSRGHLGSQLERKAETEIRLRQDSDSATSYWTTLARGEKVLETAGLRFKWSKEQCYHVAAGSKKEEKDDAALRGVLPRLHAIFGTVYDEYRYSDLVNKIRAEFGVQEKAAQHRLRIWKQNGIVLHTPKRRWHLNPELSGPHSPDPELGSPHCPVGENSSTNAPSALV